MKRIAPVTWSLVALAGAALWPANALPAPAPDSAGGALEDVTRWLVVQPGYPGSTEDATGFMDLFSAYLKRRTALPDVRGTYHNVPEDALAAMRAGRPAFALVSLGFYLEHRRRLGLAPLLESEPQDRFVIVAPEGTVEGPGALRGSKVAGGPLHERVFLERVVFPDAAVASWMAEPVLRPSRALRRLDRGMYTAVVLTGREYEAFGALSRGKKLEKVLESAYYPQTLLVYLTPERLEEKPVEEKPVEENRVEEKPVEENRVESGRDSDPSSRGRAPGGPESTDPESSEQASELSEEQRLRLEQAFLSLEKDAEGKALLKTMGIRGFVAVRSEWLERMEGTFDAEEKK